MFYSACVKLYFICLGSDSLPPVKYGNVDQERECSEWFPEWVWESDQRYERAHHEHIRIGGEDLA